MYCDLNKILYVWYLKLPPLHMYIIHISSLHTLYAYIPVFTWYLKIPPLHMYIIYIFRSYRYTLIFLFSRDIWKAPLYICILFIYFQFIYIYAHIPVFKLYMKLPPLHVYIIYVFRLYRYTLIFLFSRDVWKFPLYICILFIYSVYIDILRSYSYFHVIFENLPSTYLSDGEKRWVTQIPLSDVCSSKGNDANYKIH